MPKPPMFNGRRVTCCYCKRQLDPPTPEIKTSLTRQAGERRRLEEAAMLPPLQLPEGQPAAG
jgi:hypothetical protein